ncbi:MAG: hypothetical protein Q4G05_02630 [Clostridia bacterium]|nr:hypothetical protein [Clostridia bacterium]
MYEYKVVNDDNSNRDILTYIKNGETTSLLTATEIKIMGEWKNKLYFLTYSKYDARQKAAYYIPLNEQVGPPKPNLIVSIISHYHYDIENDIKFIFPRKKTIKNPFDKVITVLSEKIKGPDNCERAINYVYLDDGLPILAIEGTVIGGCFFETKSFIKVINNGCTEIYDTDDGTPLYMTDKDVHLYTMKNNSTIFMNIFSGADLLLVYSYSMIFKKFILLFKPKYKSKINMIILQNPTRTVYIYEDDNCNIKTYTIQ